VEGLGVGKYLKARPKDAAPADGDATDAAAAPYLSEVEAAAAAAAAAVGPEPARKKIKTGGGFGNFDNW
jgi:hypothetical protein